jgi:hypothetical protein
MVWTEEQINNFNITQKLLYQLVMCCGTGSGGTQSSTGTVRSWITKNPNLTKMDMADIGTQDAFDIAWHEIFVWNNLAELISATPIITRIDMNQGEGDPNIQEMFAWHIIYKDVIAPNVS